MAINKVIVGTEVKLDLTSDTVTNEKLLVGVKAHDKSGAQIVGTCDFDVNSQDADVSEAEILINKTAYARGNKLTGTMPNRGAVAGEIATRDGVYTPPMGFHDGSGTVKIAESEQSKIIPANIREGIEILGVTGTMSGMEGANPQAKSVTPTLSEQVVLPDEGYNYLSQVTVAAIPITEIDNSAGGKTLTIGG